MNHLIRKITPAGVVTTLAGTGTAGSADGPAASASFYNPYKVAIDATGNVYVADYNNNEIRLISAGGIVSTIAGSTSGAANGVGTAAQFSNPAGVCLDGAGNLYVSDYGNSEIRKISLTGYSISPALPAGLSINSSTGAISGTPTTTSAVTNYTVSAANGGGTSTAIVSITVNAGLQAPAIAYASPQTYTMGTAITSLVPTNSGGAVPATTYSQVTTLAGSKAQGSANGTGAAASFYSPYGLTTDAAGNVYVADLFNYDIRKVTPAGVVTTFAGSGAEGAVNGTGTAASFANPYGVAIDASGNIYVADEGNYLIRKITPTGVVTVLAGSGASGSANGTGTAASFGGPFAVATDASGNVYVADQQNNTIRKVTPAGVVTTLAGSGTAGSANGTGTAASFDRPSGVATDAAGDVYVADVQNNLIRKITPAGVVSTFAGSGVYSSVDGTGTSASFSGPSSVGTDGLGNVYVADNGLIRKITPAGVVTTLAGISNARTSVNGIGTSASFTGTNGVATDNNGNLYVSDSGNLIRKIVSTGYTITPALPAGLSFDGTTGIITGTPASGSPATNYTVTAYNTGGSSTTTVSITVGALPAPNISYAGPQTYTTNAAIASLAPTNSGGAVPATVYSQVTTLAGSGAQGAANGTGTAATFYSPNGAATDAQGNVYVADVFNQLIRKITPAGVVTTFAGSGIRGSANGTGSAASFSNPYSVATDAAGNVYVADAGNYLIRKITPAGVVTTFAGSGTQGSADGTATAASFNTPIAVATDAAGNIYVGDQGNNNIRKITPAGVVTTFAGSGTAGFVNGTGTAASFNQPDGGGN